MEIRAEGSGDCVFAAAGVELGVVYGLAGGGGISGKREVGNRRGGLALMLRKVHATGGWLGWAHTESQTAEL